MSWFSRHRFLVLQQHLFLSLIITIYFNSLKELINYNIVVKFIQVIRDCILYNLALRCHGQIL